MHLLWVAAVIFFFIWLVGFAIGRRERASRHHNCFPVCLLGPSPHSQSQEGPPVATTDKAKNITQKRKES